MRKLGHRKLIDLPKVIKLEVPQPGFESRTHTTNCYILLPLDVIETNWRQKVLNEVMIPGGVTMTQA